MNTHPAAFKHRCSLTVANIGVTLTCDNERLAAALRERYHAFPLHGHVELRLDVAVLDTAAVPAAVDLVVNDAVVRHAIPDYPCCIDVGAGHGQIVVSQRHALEEMEYWLRVAYALLVFRGGGLLFHAAGLVRNGRGFLFCGRSGSGKTTVARVSPDALVLNDDLVVLLPHAHGWIVHATPFSNPTQVQPVGPAHAPIAAVFRLVQDTTVRLVPLHGALALAELIANVPVLSADPSLSQALFARCRQFLHAVPVYHLHFLPDASFWPVAEASVS